MEYYPQPNTYRNVWFEDVDIPHIQRIAEKFPMDYFKRGILEKDLLILEGVPYLDLEKIGYPAPTRFVQLVLGINYNIV